MPAERIPTLHTPRLLLRAFGPTDLDAYAAVCADPEVMRYIGTGQPQPRDAAWRQMALFLGHWALRGHGQWAVCLREPDGRCGAFVGRVGTLQPEGWPGCELAWLLARSAWGRGYAFEAVSAARQHLRDALGMLALESYILPGNAASERLALRLGARLEGSVSLLGMTVPRWLHPQP